MARAGTITIATLAWLALAAATARADDAGWVGTYRLSGREGARALSGTVVIRPDGGGLRLTGPLGSRGEVELLGAAGEGDLELEPAGDAGPAPTAGLAGALAGPPPGETAGPPASFSVRLRRVKPGALKGELVDAAGAVKARLDLTRRSRTLVAHATGYDAKEDRTFLSYGRMVRTYYRARGHEVVMLPVDSWAALLAELVRAGDAGEPYVRVVTLGHGGWDGPMFHGQLSPWYAGTGWSDLVDAVRRGTAPEAKVYVSACHAAGSNRYEDYRPDDKWVDRLARATGRVVAGPAGSTSTTLALRQVRAMEGAGTAAQETRVASAEGVRVIARSGGGLASAKRLTWEQVDAAAGAP